MQWNEVRIAVASQDAETAAAIAMMTVPYGIYIEDYSDMDEMLPQVGRVDYVDADLLARDRTRAVIHIYLPENTPAGEVCGFLEERLAASDIAHTIETVLVGDEDWAENWKKHYKPERIGERLVVCPSWESFAPREGDVVLRMDPGAAFGSGKHETTALCLRLLERETRAGDRVLDMGCGSGILSIAALLLGAGSAVAVDIDPNAVKVALENAKDNGLDGSCYRAEAGNVLEDDAFAASLGDGYDLLCANIVADVILGMRSFFLRCLRPGGRMLVSGIIDTRAGEVSEGLLASGFAVLERLEDNGWAALLVQKPE